MFKNKGFRHSSFALRQSMRGAKRLSWILCMHKKRRNEHNLVLYYSKILANSKSAWEILLIYNRDWILCTLKYGMMALTGINEPPRKFGKNNNRSLWKTQKWEFFGKKIDIHFSNFSEGNLKSISVDHTYFFLYLIIGIGIFLRPMFETFQDCSTL